MSFQFHDYSKRAQAGGFGDYDPFGVAATSDAAAAAAYAQEAARRAGGNVQTGGHVYDPFGVAATSDAAAAVAYAQEVARRAGSGQLEVGGYVGDLELEEPGVLRAMITAGGEGLERAKEAAKAGSVAALKALADSGDILAKIALMFGVGYGAATMILAAGGVGLLLVVLKRK